MIPFWKQKTFWSCVGAIVVAVGGVVSGTIEAQVAIELVATALIGIFLRQGVEKSKPSNEK